MHLYATVGFVSIPVGKLLQTYSRRCLGFWTVPKVLQVLQWQIVSSFTVCTRPALPVGVYSVVGQSIATLCLYLAATTPVAIDTGDRIGIFNDSRCIASMASTPEGLLCNSAEG